MLALFQQTKVNVSSVSRILDVSTWNLESFLEFFHFSSNCHPTLNTMGQRPLLPPVNEVCEGNVFTCVCLSTGFGDMHGRGHVCNNLKTIVLICHLLL